ncbi:MAG: acyltransferase family protein [Akkermansiaceae bacterium]
MKNLSAIGVLRGLAAIAVMLFHFSAEKYGAPNMWRNIFINGQLGVHAFFIISGFVIPLQLSRKQYKLNKIFHFLINRFVRIYPNFLIVSFITVLVWFAQHHLLGGTQAPDIRLSNIIKNLSLTANPLGGHYYVNVSWTLAIEFMYYVILGIAFPLLFSTNSSIRISSNTLLLLSYFLIGAYASWNFFAWTPYFTVGFMLYRIKASKVDFESASFLLVSLTIIAIDPGFLPSLNQLLVVLIVCAMILFTPELKQKPLLFLGEISYSLYLTHNLFGAKTFKFIEVLGWTEKMGYFPSLFVAIAISIVFAFIFYKLIEVPSHILSKKVWRSSRVESGRL